METIFTMSLIILSGAAGTAIGAVFGMFMGKRS